MNKDQLIAYLELIATQIKEIRHNLNDKKKFGYYEDLGTSSMKLSLKEFCFLPYKSIIEPRITDNGKEQYFVRLPVMFEISKAVSNKESAVEIKQAQQGAAIICTKIWRRMLFDERQRNHIFSVGRVKFDGGWNFQDVEAGFENLCGHNIRFNLVWQIDGIDDEYDINNDFVI